MQKKKTSLLIGLNCLYDFDYTCIFKLFKELWVYISDVCLFFQPIVIAIDSGFDITSVNGDSIHSQLKPTQVATKSFSDN